MKATCPCGRGPAFEACCARYLGTGVPAPDAESLMRSRYVAFARGDMAHLLATWHASQRPPSLELDTGVKWLGLEVKRHTAIDADHAEVEFVARSRIQGRGQRLHERSRFVRENGHWFYVDGDILPLKEDMFEAVLFDCDGVLVDSEPITNGVLREVLNESGWAITQAECMQIFIGKAVRDERTRIEAETGQPFTEAWLHAFYERRNVRLLAELKAVEGAVEAVAAIHRQVDGRIACASGADRPKVVMQLDLVGLLPFFGERIFSGHDQPRSKPAPDVYLAAAAHLGADPTRCLVIEDTATGAQAGLAAGATVWGYCPEGHGRAFEGLGVHRVFHHMDELRQLFAAPVAR